MRKYKKAILNIFKKHGFMYGWFESEYVIDLLVDGRLINKAQEEELRYYSKTCIDLKFV